MKIETRKRKRATQKVKANFSLVQRASVLFLLFRRSLRYPFGHLFSSSVGTRMRRKRD